MSEGSALGVRKRAVRRRLSALADEAAAWLLSAEGEAAVEEAVRLGACRWGLVGLYSAVWKRELARLGLLDDEAVMCAVAVTLEEAARGAAAVCGCARCASVRAQTEGGTLWEFDSSLVVGREPRGLEWTEASVRGFVRSVERLRA